MAKYKHYDYGQAKMLPVRFEEQILPGTFEYTLNRLIDERFNLEVFDAHYKNDDTGAPAYDPAILLKILLYAYARGVTSSREIERLCRENVVFMALSADSRPHFTTIAAFIAKLGDPIVSVFRDVLLVCDEIGLIGREMFAIDGVKLPSNASKEWSGTRADFGKKIEKMERAVEHLVKRHREADASGEGTPLERARAKQIDTLEAALTKVRGFLRSHEDKVGAGGRVKKSNITDPESAKMKTSKGVIQGYTGVAVVDGKHQIVVGAEAFGEGQEHGLLVPMLEHTREAFRELGCAQDALRGWFSPLMPGSTPMRTWPTSSATASTAMWPIRCSGSATRALRRPSGTSRPQHPIRIGCSAPRTSSSTRPPGRASAQPASSSTAVASTTVRTATVRSSSRVPRATVAPARCDIGVCATPSAPLPAKWCCSSGGSNRRTPACA